MSWRTLDTQDDTFDAERNGQGRRKSHANGIVGRKRMWLFQEDFDFERISSSRDLVTSLWRVVYGPPLVQVWSSQVKIEPKRGKEEEEDGDEK